VKITLTSLELKILKHTSEGLSTSDLSRDLQMREKDVNANLKSIYKKLQTTEPLTALQKLAKSDFVVVDR